MNTQFISADRQNGILIFTTPDDGYGQPNAQKDRARIARSYTHPMQMQTMDLLS
jgi:hypothetical protein